MPLTAGRTLKINNCLHVDKLPLPPFSHCLPLKWDCSRTASDSTGNQALRREIYHIQPYNYTPKTPICSLLVPLLHDVAFSFLQRWREDRGMHYWFQLQSAQSYDRRHTYENTQTDSGCLFFISLCASMHSLSLIPNNSLTLIHWNKERCRTCINILRWCVQILAVIKTTQQSEFTLSLFESQQSPRVCLRKREKRSGATRPDAALFHLGGRRGRYRSCSYLKQTPAVWQPGCLLHPQNINILLTHLWAEDKTPSLLWASKQHKGQHLRLAFPQRVTRISTNSSIKIGSVGIRSAQRSILANKRRRSNGH